MQEQTEKQNNSEQSQQWLTAIEILKKLKHPVQPLPYRNPIGSLLSFLNVIHN